MVATTTYQAGVESNAVVLSYAQESVWKTNPSVAYKALRYTGESLSGQKQRVRPGEISTVLQASAAVTTQESAGGSVNFALSYGTFDDLLSGLLSEEWGAAVTVDSIGTDIAFVATGNKMTSTLAGKFNSLTVGMWIRVFGSATTNDGIYRISAKTSGTDVTLAGKTVVNETSAAGNIKVRHGGQIRNGNVFKSFVLQKQLASNLFLRYPGSYISGGNVAANMGQFLSGAFNFISASEENFTANGSTGAVTAAPTGRVHDPVAGFGGVYLDDVLVGASAGAISMDIGWDGAASQFALGSAAAQGVIQGQLTATGRLSVYFRDFTLYTRFKNETQGRISFRTADPDGASYTFTFLSALILNPSIVAGGRGQPVMADFTLEANPDATTGLTVQIDRLAATAA